MLFRVRALFAPSLGLALLVASSALAGDDGSDPKPAQPTAPPQEAPPADQADAAVLLRRLEAIYPRALQKPDPSVLAGLTGPDLVKARNELVKAEQERDQAVKDLATTGDRYLAAIGDAAPDANALYYRGAGKAILATRQNVAEAVATREAAVDSLARYVAVADEKAAYVADAEMHLGTALVFLSAKDPKRFEEAIPHLRRAVELLQTDNRHADAGETAHLALSQLVSLDRSGEARAFADAIGAAKADFGPSTPEVRKLVAATHLTVGARFPDLPELTDVDGKPFLPRPRSEDGKTLLPWPADGKPLLLHFFLTGFADGNASSFRDIETDVRPLWQKYREKGLRVAGVCMDYAIPKAQADEKRRQWKEEWGKNAEYRDGSLDLCRTWAKTHGVEWPWYWDGKWTANPVSVALGGVGVSSPYAVLVDGEGVIRWRGACSGQTGYVGLEEAVAKVVK